MSENKNSMTDEDLIALARQTLADPLMGGVITALTPVACELAIRLRHQANDLESWPERNEASRKDHASVLADRVHVQAYRDRLEEMEKGRTEAVNRVAAAIEKLAIAVSRS